MKVLGIDPGYGRCGMAVVNRDDGKDSLVYSSCVETSAADDFPVRLNQIIDECGKLLKHHSPDAFAIEKLYFANNQKTAMHVAEVRGALISCAMQHDVPVFEYTPAQVKSAVAGHGGAQKKQIAAMLMLLLKMNKKIQHDDEYDAIAVGVTHLAHARMYANSLKSGNAIQ
jgi:crossover junction endodeoxyribonuclease RuvC